MQKLVYSSEMVALFYFILDISNRISKIKQPLPKVLFCHIIFFYLMNNFKFFVFSSPGQRSCELLPSLGVRPSVCPSYVVNVHI